MGRVLPILFNTYMVRAILDGRKTVTRRVVKYPPHPDMPDNHNYCQMPLWMRIRKDEYDFRILHFMDVIEQNPFKQIRYFESLAPFDKGDILYVRETWNFVYEMDGNDRIIEDTGRYVYCADDPMPFSHWVDTDTGEHKDYMPWKPSIHMPKEAARIWLKVTNVRVKRLHDMTLDDFLSEGVAIRPEAFNDPENAYMQARSEFARIWDSTSRKSQIDLNPWVWVIEFERCEKPEEN